MSVHAASRLPCGIDLLYAICSRNHNVEKKKKNRKRRKQEEPQKYGRGKIRLERESGKLEEEETESRGVGPAGETEWSIISYWLCHSGVNPSRQWIRLSFILDNSPVQTNCCNWGSFRVNCYSHAVLKDINCPVIASVETYEFQHCSLELFFFIYIYIVYCKNPRTQTSDLIWGWSEIWIVTSIRFWCTWTNTRTFKCAVFYRGLWV